MFFYNILLLNHNFWQNKNAQVEKQIQEYLLLKRSVTVQTKTIKIGIRSFLAKSSALKETE